MRKRTMILLVFLVLLVLGLEFFVGFFCFLPLLFSLSFYKRLFLEKGVGSIEIEEEISKWSDDLDWEEVLQMGECPIITHQNVDEHKS